MVLSFKGALNDQFSPPDLCRLNMEGKTFPPIRGAPLWPSVDTPDVSRASDLKFVFRFLLHL